MLKIPLCYSHELDSDDYISETRERPYLFGHPLTKKIVIQSSLGRISFHRSARKCEEANTGYCIVNIKRLALRNIFNNIINRMDFLTYGMQGLQSKEYKGPMLNKLRIVTTKQNYTALLDLIFFELPCLKKEYENEIQAYMDNKEVQVAPPIPTNEERSLLQKRIIAIIQKVQQRSTSIFTDKFVLSLQQLLNPHSPPIALESMKVMLQDAGLEDLISECEQLNEWAQQEDGSGHQVSEKEIAEACDTMDMIPEDNLQACAQASRTTADESGYEWSGVDVGFFG